MDEKYIFKNQCKANHLNDYFASICVANNGVVSEMQPLNIDNNLSVIEFTPNRLYNIMRKLKNPLAAGPDGFPHLFFKKTSVLPADPLCVLFNHIFRCETIPSA